MDDIHYFSESLGDYSRTLTMIPIYWQNKYVVAWAYLVETYPEINGLDAGRDELSDKFKIIVNIFKFYKIFVDQFDLFSVH